MDYAATFDEQIAVVEYLSVFCLCVDVAAFGLSILVILKFTREPMRDMKFHLLNISVMVFLSDLFMDLLTSPIPVYPFIGVCSVSRLGEWINQRFGNQVGSTTVLISQLILLGGSAAAVCNATLHRFYITKNAGTAANRTPRSLFAFMIFGQFGYIPLLSIAIAHLDPTPDYMVRLYQQEYPLILDRVNKWPHALLLDIYHILSENRIFTLGVTLSVVALLYSVVSTTVYAWLSWRLLDGMRLSDNARKMKKQLMVSMVLQSIVPFVAYVTGGLIIICVLYFHPVQSTPFVIICYLIFGMHSVLNCAAMCLAIPPYRRAVVRMLAAALSWQTTAVAEIPKSDRIQQRRQTTALLGLTVEIG